MLMRMGLGGDLFWRLSMGLLAMVGVPVRLLRHMGWDYGSIFVGDGVSLNVISDLLQGRAPKSDSGRTFGVGKVP
jgi:hypothetical protein